jgi:homopolymeric O-antigen transport system ATP-binding protein
LSGRCPPCLPHIAASSSWIHSGISSAAIGAYSSAASPCGAGFNAELTGRQNVILYSTLAGLTRSEAQARLPEILRFADIGPHVDQPMKTYAISIDPDILIIDEALAVGNGLFQ